jgi:hypothetical protein
MRRLFAALIAVLCLAVGIGLFALPDLSWFRAAMGVFMFGQALRWISLDPGLARVRDRIGISSVRGFHVMAAAYVLAGVLAVVGALTSLERMFGLIVTAVTGMWIWFWVRAFQVARRSTESERDASES